MAGKLLDGEDIDACAQQMRNAGTSKIVSREVVYTSLLLTAAQDVGDATAAQVVRYPTAWFQAGGSLSTMEGSDGGPCG